MDYKINLKELSLRESERVEWKENGDDAYIVRSIVKTISAFANDLANFGGGYVVCGAKETKDQYGFPTVAFTGLTPAKLNEIQGKVLQHCPDFVSPPVAPIVHEMTNPENPQTRILVFIVLASNEVHVYRDGDKVAYYVRISKETREARNGILTQLLLKKQKLAYFDKRINAQAGIEDIDVILFRDCMQEMGLLYPEKSLENFFSDTEKIAELVPPLFGKNNLDNVLRPKNFTMLLFGKKSAITLFYPEAYTVFSIYKGTDRSEPTAERYLLTGSIIEQAKKSIELLNAQAYTVFDKTNQKPNQVKYPVRALQEAVVNAIVHRDYELPEPIRITVFADRIEIESPGSLHWGIDKEKFLQGKASAKWRNQSFAYLFNKLQLAQAEGQGIPTIFRTMKEEGCPQPTFELGNDSLTCILPAHPRHQTIKTLQNIQEAIILHRYEEAKKQVLQLIDTDPYNYRVLDLFCEIVQKQHQPQELYAFLKTKQPDYRLINANTLVNIANVLSYAHYNPDMRLLAKQVIEIAKTGKIEENQVLKAIQSVSKVSEPEMALDFIQQHLAQNPNLAVNPSVLEHKATLKIDLVKKCIKTLRNQLTASDLQVKAKNKGKLLLEEANHDLAQALQLYLNRKDKNRVTQHLLFTKELQTQL